MSNHEDLVFRVDSLDWWIFDNIQNKNEYKLNEYLRPDAVVLDIGSHAGYFADYCMKLGARKVYCYEMDKENYELSLQNLEKYSDSIIVNNLAVWRSDITLDKAYYGDYSIWGNLINTGGIGMVLEGGPKEVDTVQLDDIIDQIISVDGKIHLMKIDAESAEWSILLTSELLSSINTVIGEYHEIGGEYDNHNPDILDLGYKRYDLLLLKRHFEMLGYKFRSNRYTNLNIGHFWATKR